MVAAVSKRVPSAGTKSSPLLQAAPFSLSSPGKAALSGTQPRVRLQTAPGIWALEATPLQGALLWLQKGASPTAGEDGKGARTQAGSARVLHTHPHRHTPIGPAEGRGSSWNASSRLRCPGGRALPERRGPPRPPPLDARDNFAPFPARLPPARAVAGLPRSSARSSETPPSPAAGGLATGMVAAGRADGAGAGKEEGGGGRALWPTAPGAAAGE